MWISERPAILLQALEVCKTGPQLKFSYFPEANIVYHRSRPEALEQANFVAGLYAQASTSCTWIVQSIVPPFTQVSTLCMQVSHQKHRSKVLVVL